MKLTQQTGGSMFRITVLLLGLSAGLTACNKRSERGADGAENAATQNTVVAESPAPAPADATATFSIESVPVSRAELGAFPRFELPTGYKTLNKPVTRDFDRFPSWTGAAFSQVEGKTYSIGIQGETESRYSAEELKSNLESTLSRIGASKIFDGKVSRDQLDRLPQAQRDHLQEQYGAPYNAEEIQTWVVRRSDKILWITLAIGAGDSYMTVVEEKPLAITAKLLPAAALSSSIEQTGKAVIHVNFATDQANILPDSKPQIVAVTTLLEGSPELRLSLNGYTDDTGSPEHNRALSQARADAVLASLISAGIDRRRLEAKGFGKNNPVSANSEEAGKALNRRVELVRIDN